MGVCEHRERGFGRQGEETVQECALSLQCGLQVSEEHSSKETAGGRAVLAAEAVAQLFSLVQVSVIPNHSNQEREQQKTTLPT